MSCPYCACPTTTERTQRTVLGISAFGAKRAGGCAMECTGTPFNFLEYPTAVVLWVVLWQPRYKLRRQDLAAMFLPRSFHFTPEAIRDGEARFTPLISKRLRTKRRGKARGSWSTDKTHARVKGYRWYWYRAIDRDGNFVASLLRQKRDMTAAKRFFSQALEVVGHAPARMTTPLDTILIPVPSAIRWDALSLMAATAISRTASSKIIEV